MATTKNIPFALQSDEEDPVETLHVYPVEGGILVTREELEPEYTPSGNSPHFQIEKYALPFVLAMLCFLICIDTMIFFFLSLLMPTATITIIPEERDITLRTTLTTTKVQGRILPVLTLSQTKTVPATGRGHQDATYASGYITFYNGLLTAQTINAGTILTGADGVQVITDQNASIPAAFPPTEGSVIVSAHALLRGSRGNIEGRDINMACCSTAVLAHNSSPFQGGQDARDFVYVAKNDIGIPSSSLKIAVSQSLTSALEGEAQAGESVFPLKCSEVVQTDHKVGDESHSVTITVSRSCSAFAYNREDLQRQGRQVLSENAKSVLGQGYIPFGAANVKVIAVVPVTGGATISISIEGLWVYQVSPSDEAHMKDAIRGKTKAEAIKILSSMPGIRKVAISGVSDDSPLPAIPERIHLFLLYGGI